MNLEQELWVGYTHCRKFCTDDPPTATEVLGTYTHYITTADRPQSSNAWNNPKLGFFFQQISAKHSQDLLFKTGNKDLRNNTACCKLS